MPYPVALHLKQVRIPGELGLGELVQVEELKQLGQVKVGAGHEMGQEGRATRQVGQVGPR